MATIHVKEETYQKLALRAADQSTTVDELVEPVLQSLATLSPPLVPYPTISAAERRIVFEEWMELVRQRSDRYPPGFVADDSRESIYAGCGE